MNPLERNRCQKLADDIASEMDISAKVYNAFCEVSRTEFAPVSAHAFSLSPQPILANQWISSPLTVAKMTMTLELDDADSVLEIGCGTGYQAAILSKIVRRVFTIERIQRLADEAKKHFANLGISNVNVRYDDGNNGWKTYAPYDRILLSAAAKQIDKKLFEQLSEGGILVAPMQKKDKQFIIKFKKTNLGIREEIIEECIFVPLLEGRE